MVDLGTNKKVSTPLPAVVGQSDLKRVLLALAVEPGLSGALLRGEKGTAKSTSVRALADLLPEQAVVADCPYGCPPPETVEAAGETGGAAAAAERCESCRDRDDPPVETRPAPLVTLPLGATRDRVVGTLSVADALDGEAEFDPGLLARANRGILYVDEVNLLPDHLVDVLLDAAAAGTNRVERDGVSVAHPADFTLVGTMNPEEGELRPQLRDRFDLCVDVAGSDEIDERVEILDRVVDGADGGDRDLRAEFAEETAALRERVREARERRPAIPEAFKRDIAECCRDAGVDGHRADFAVARAARAFAALDGRPKLLESDVAAAAEHALAHRLRSAPFDEATDPEAIVDEHFDDDAEGDTEPESDGEEPAPEGADADESDADESDGGEAGSDGDEKDAGEGGASGDGDGGDRERDGADGDGDESDGADRPPADASRDSGPRDGDAGDPDDPDRSPGGATAADRDDGADEEAPGADDEAPAPIAPGAARAEIGDATAPDVPAPGDGGDEADAGDETGGRHAAAPAAEGRGPTVRTERADGSDAADPAATVRAAARNGRTTPTDTDLRRAVRDDDARALTVFVADASASMAPAMRAAKGVALELLRDAYAERDEVALVSFGGDEAEVLLPPTASVSLAARQLKELPTADRTPLPDGLRTAAALVEREDPAAATVVLVSDGRANVTDGSPTAATRRAADRLAMTGASVLVVDAGEPRAGVLDVVCEATDARRTDLAALSPESVLGDH